MPKPLHDKNDVRQFSQGADFDDSTQFIGASDAGAYVDANNMRHTDSDQDSLTKIGGESLLYDALMNACTIPIDPLTGIPYGPPPSTMVNIGAIDFFLEDDKTTHNIEFWADSLSTYPSYIRIDGVIVCLSVDLPFTYNHPLQIAKNENCVGGEVYPTDYNVAPMIFNVKDLMVNGGFTFDGVTICTTKYFGAFNVNEYYVELASDNNHPIFIRISPTPPQGAEVIGTLGLKPGLYQYQTRKVTADGDATAWSKASPLIPMVMNYTFLNKAYPYMKTRGGSTADTSIYGIQIRFRVDNAAGYDYLQIKRTRYTDETAIGTGGVEKLLDYRLDLSDGDFFVKDIFDVGALELDLPDDSLISGFASLKRAKTVRYYNARLVYMNIEYQDRDVSSVVTIDENANGKRMFPVIQKITTPINQSGHKDPYNYAYYRTLMRGEKYGWAIDFRDGNNQISFALPVPNSSTNENYQDYQMPNRRDICAPETVQYSNGTVKAANVDGLNVTAQNPLGVAVQQTHEVFDTVDSYNKTDSVDAINVFYRNTSNTAVQNYKPFTPTSQLDGDVSKWDYIVNTEVSAGDSVFVNNQPYNPLGFGLNYFALGMAVNSVTNIPKYIKSFSVVRTKPATRVVAQGLGFYRLSYTPTIDTGTIFVPPTNPKAKNQIVFYSPDLDEDTSIDPQVLDKIQQSIGSGRYKLQMVSPLGFFAETYSSHRDNLGASRLATEATDLIAYARILREDGTINPLDSPDGAANSGINGVGISASPVDGYGYTGYGKWRARGAQLPANPFQNNGNGNQLFDITNITIEQGSGTYSERSQQIIMTVSPSLYDTDIIDISTGLQAVGFTKPQTQQWHEPMYVVNIIDTLASVPQPNIKTYLETEHYQKTEALIGSIAGGTTREEFLIVDERRDDYATAIFVEAQDGTRTVYMNVTAIQSNIPALGAVVNAIQLGLQTVFFAGSVRVVTGIYIVATTVITDSYSEDRVVFDTTLNSFGVVNPIPIFMPNPTDKVYVLYDSSIPVKAFGGDASIHESIFSPIDTSNNSNGDPINTQLDFGYPFPYLRFRLNNNYRRPGDVSLSWGSSTESFDFASFLLGTGYAIKYGRIRQIAAMFSCESRICLPYLFETGVGVGDRKFFPATNYVVRPFAWDPNLAPDFQTSFFHGAYVQSYPNEENIWGFGGFKFKPQTNIDYSRQDEDHTVTSKPTVGNVDRNLFCTGVIWSLERPENLVDAPGLRTFPATNLFITSDDTGDIKYAYDELTEGKGNNLWAITDSGVCLLITDKTLLYGKTGDELATIGSSGGSTWVQGQLWVSKTVGMNDEFWRSAAEGYNVIKGDLSERRVEALFFSNKVSQYRLSQGALFDIGRGGKYHSRIYPTYLKLAGKDYSSPMSAIYDEFNDEYWSCFFHVNGKYTIAFAERKGLYRGTFDYLFDKFTSFEGNTYGMRNAKTYILDQYGSDIGGQPIESTLVGVSAKQPNDSKNFSRIRISPPFIKPTTVLFYGTKEEYLANANRAEIDTVLLPLSLKDYGAWEGFIPRKVAGNRDRVQGQQVIFVIKSLGNDKFKINTTDIGFTEIK